MDDGTGQDDPGQAECRTRKLDGGERLSRPDLGEKLEIEEQDHDEGKCDREGADFELVADIASRVSIGDDDQEEGHQDEQVEVGHSNLPPRTDASVNHRQCPDGHRFDVGPKEAGGRIGQDEEGRDGGLDRQQPESWAGEPATMAGEDRQV